MTARVHHATVRFYRLPLRIQFRQCDSLELHISKISGELFDSTNCLSEFIFGSAHYLNRWLPLFLYNSSIRSISFLQSWSAVYLASAVRFLGCLPYTFYCRVCRLIAFDRLPLGLCYNEHPIYIPIIRRPARFPPASYFRRNMGIVQRLCRPWPNRLSRRSAQAAKRSCGEIPCYRVQY